MAVKIPDPTALGERPVPQPSGSISVPAGDAGPMMAQSGRILESAGAQLNDTANEIYRRSRIEQGHRDAARTEDAFNKLRDQQLDLTLGEENGFTKVKGADANHDLVLKSTERYKNAVAEIEKTLDNDEQKEKFRLRAAAAGTQFTHELLTHVAKEDQLYKKETYEGVGKTEVRNATARWDDPTAVEFSIARVSEEVAKRAQEMKWPPEYAEAQRQEKTGQIHAAVIMQAIASNQWEYAQKWYEANKADIDPQTAKVLEKAVEDGTQKQTTAGYTTEFLASRDDRKGLQDLEQRVTADPKLDETRKNALLGRILARGETLDRRDDAERVRQEKAVEKSINQVNSNTRAGFEPSLEQLTPILNAARGTALEGEAQRMVELAKSTRAFRFAQPQQQEAAITRAETLIRQDPTKFDLQLLTSWKEIYQKQQAAIQADPVTYAARQGLVDETNLASKSLDLSNPQALGEQLAARYALARGMTERYQAPFKPLTKEEVDLAVGTLRNGTVEQKRLFFGTLAQASRGDMDGYRAMMGQLAPDDPVTAHGGVMAGRGYQAKDGEISVGRGSYVADLIFRGQALMSPNKKEDGKPTHGKLWPMPEGKDEKTMRDVFESEEKGSLSRLGTAREDYLQTAKVIYASLSEDSRDATGVLDSSRWRQAIKLATGGFADQGGKRVMLPYGYTDSQFKDGLAARVEAYGDRLPDTITQKKLLDLPLQPAGDGVYMFHSGDSIVLDKTGRPITIDFNRSAPFKTSGSDMEHPEAVRVGIRNVSGTKVPVPKELQPVMHPDTSLGPRG